MKLHKINSCIHKKIKNKSSYVFTTTEIIKYLKDNNYSVFN